MADAGAVLAPAKAKHMVMRVMQRSAVLLTESDQADASLSQGCVSIVSAHVCADGADWLIEQREQRLMMQDACDAEPLQLSG